MESAPIPLILRCKRCRRLFNSGFALMPGVHDIALENCASKCRWCGSEEAIPDGTYSAVLGDIVTLVRDALDPLGALKKLAAELGTVRSAEAFEELKANSPSLKKSPELTYARLGLIIAIIGALISGWQTFGPQNKPVSYEQLLELYNRAMPGEPRSAATRPARSGTAATTQTGTSDRREKRRGAHTLPKPRNRKGRKP